MFSLSLNSKSCPELWWRFTDIAVLQSHTVGGPKLFSWNGQIKWWEMALHYVCVHHCFKYRHELIFLGKETLGRVFLYNFKIFGLLSKLFFRPPDAHRAVGRFHINSTCQSSSSGAQRCYLLRWQHLLHQTSLLPTAVPLSLTNPIQTSH